MADQGFTWRGPLQPTQPVLDRIKGKKLYGDKLQGDSDLILTLLNLMTKFGNPAAGNYKPPGGAQPVPTPDPTPLQGDAGQRTGDIEEEYKRIMGN